MSEQYVNISLDLQKNKLPVIDIRVPKSLSVKELLSIIKEAYAYDLLVCNPCVRIQQTGAVLTGPKRLEECDDVKNGISLILESL